MTVNQMFNDGVLEAFIKTFYGYGNYEGAYWFIGMEESGGNFRYIDKKLDTWLKRGKLELEDVAQYHEALGIKNLFGEDARLQPTWNKLIRILLSVEGQKNAKDKESVRSYQINLLGRSNRNTFLLDLFPLPCRSTKDWLYDKHSDLPYLSSRSTYTKFCAEWRTIHIRNLIQQHKPKVVIFYGKGYKNSWLEIADVSFSETPEGAYIGSNAQTVFAIAKHPVTPGLKNEYFHRLGELIASQLDQS